MNKKTFLGILITAIVVMAVVGVILILNWQGVPIQLPLTPTSLILASYQQCQKDSDCVVVSPICGNSKCLPQNKKCQEDCFNVIAINKDYKDVWNESGKSIHCIGQAPLCKPMPSLSSYDSVCQNNLCQAVLKRPTQEVTITTDKTEYQEGEMVKIAIKNNSKDEKLLWYPFYTVEKYVAGSINGWIEMERLLCPCGAMCKYLPYLQMPPGHTNEFQWNQREETCVPLTALPGTKMETVSSQVPAGKYRATMTISEPNVTSFSSDDSKRKTIYSNEFFITESSGGDFQDMTGIRDHVSCYCFKSGYLTTDEGKKVPVCYKEIQGDIACKKDVRLNGYFQTETITPSPMSTCPPGSLNIFQVTSYFCELPTN